MTYGHDKDNYLVVPGSSLVSAVCSGDQSLIISAAQQTLFTTIEDYITNLGGMSIGAVLCVLVLFLWFLLVGQDLCVLVLFLWFLLVGQEVAASLSLMTTLFSLMSRETELAHVPNCDDQNDKPFVLKSISRQRMVFVVLLTAVRLFICLLLLIVGSIWLSNTLSINEMILNATALAFVLDIDELIFESFTSTSSKALRSNLQPLKRPSQAIWASQLFSFFGSILTVILMVIGWVSPNISLMMDIKDVMCGGNRDFIIGPSAFGLHYGTGTNPFDPDATSFSTEIVKEVWHSDAQLPSQWSKKWVFTAELDAFNAGVAFAADPQAYVERYGSVYMKTCDDFPFSDSSAFLRPTSFFKATLEHLTGIAHVANCSSAASFCWRDDMQLLRLLCPVTCGCRNPVSGLYFDGELWGCPVDKCRQSSHYKGVLDSLPCADTDAATLAADPAWARFWEVAATFKGRRGDKQKWMRIKDDFVANGCSAHASLSDEDKTRVCRKAPAEGAMTSFCPVTCGCSNSSRLEGCATACLQG